MAFSANVWNQLKNLTAGKLVKALKKDDWVQEEKSGATLGFLKSDNPRRRIVIHYHPKKTYGAQLLKHLLDDIGWTENDLRRLKLIK